MKAVIIFILLCLIAAGLSSCDRESKGLKEEIRLLKEENSFLKADNISLKKEMEELYKRLDDKIGSQGKEAVKIKDSANVDEAVKKKR